jgi:hypothetical protein
MVNDQCGIIISPYISHLKNIPFELTSVWNAIYFLLLSHHKEPILISGPSGFKTFLASQMLPRAPVLFLHSETSITQLLGSIILMNSMQSRVYYLEHFCFITKQDRITFESLST